MSNGFFGCFPHGAAHNQSAIDSILAAVSREIGAAIAVSQSKRGTEFAISNILLASHEFHSDTKGACAPN